MAVVALDRSFFFLAVGGTGSSSVESALLNTKGRDGAALTALLGRKHATTWDLRKAGLLSEEEAAHADSFCFVRNPFDFLSADYHRSRNWWAGLLDDPNAQQEADSWGRPNDPGIHPALQPEWRKRPIRLAAELSFDDWIEDQYGERHRRGETWDLFAPYTSGVKRVYAFEQLFRGVADIGARLGLSLDLPHLLATPKAKPYWEYYSPRSREIVAALFKPTLEKYRYAFEGKF